MRKGFTLVELSIVLVIVGLLIGGILVGQSLIDSARVNRLASDLGQYEVAIVQFRDRFKQYPGDSDLFNPPGDDDREIPNFGFSGSVAREARNAWAHLSQAKMLNTEFEVYDSNVHGAYFSQSNAGVVWPNTQVDSVDFQNSKGFPGSKIPVVIRKRRVTGNISISINVNPLDSLSLEGKLGGQSLRTSFGVNQYDQVGLVNVVPVGRCKGLSNGNGNSSGRLAGGNGYDCLSESSYGRLHYLIAR